MAEAPLTIADFVGAGTVALVLGLLWWGLSEALEAVTYAGVERDVREELGEEETSGVRTRGRDV